MWGAEGGVVVSEFSVARGKRLGGGGGGGGGKDGREFSFLTA